MRNIYIFLIFILSSGNLFSQKKVLDSLSNNYIQGVEVYSSKGDLLGLSDKTGKIAPALIREIEQKSTQEFILIHPSYKTKVVALSDLSGTGDIKLIPIVVDLDEVVLEGKQQFKYLRLHTYFRSFQINNNQLHYFMDGIADYYIDLKTNKQQVIIKQHRSYENKNIKQLDEKGAVQATIQGTGTPYLKYIEYNQLKELFKFEFLENQVDVYKDKNKQIGAVKSDNKSLRLSLSHIPEHKPDTLTLFGYTFVSKIDNSNAFYSSQNIKNIGYDNLEYLKIIHALDAKNKKDKEYQSVESSNEVFVINRELTNDKIKKSLGRFRLHPKV